MHRERISDDVYVFTSSLYAQVTASAVVTTEGVDPGYYANLMSMPLVERERLYGGNWNIRPTAGSIFNRAWFTIVEAAPPDTTWVRYWDKAGTGEKITRTRPCLPR